MESNVCIVARRLGCEGMEKTVYDDRNEQQGKPAEYWLTLNIVTSEESDDDNYSMG